LFPFDPTLHATKNLVDVGVQRTDAGPEIEESYRIDPAGLVEVKISDVASGFVRTFQLGAS